MSAATGTMFMAAAQTGAGANLSTRLAVHRNFEPFQLRSDVELFSVERESPSLCWLPLPEDQPIDHKRMVVLPSPLDSVDSNVG